jgi:hypothetical protein
MEGTARRTASVFRYLLALLSFCFSSSAAGRYAHSGPAIGQFEIKTLGAEPGEIEFQSQNAYFTGNPRRLMSGDAQAGIEADDNTISRQLNALEIEVGISRYLKTRVGIEYERERLDDLGSFEEADRFGALKLEEIGAEAIVVFVPRAGDGWGLGMVVEYEMPVESGGAKTLNVGPIFEWARGPWELSLNPTLAQSLGGERNEAGQTDDKIDFGYAARLMHHWSKDIAFAIEAYGAVERIGGHGGRSDASRVFGDFNQHRAGPVAYWNTGVANGAEATLGLGVLFGLNGSTSDTALKASLEVTF